MNISTNCSNCKYAVFDETWGEWKCSMKMRYILLTEKKDCKHSVVTCEHNAHCEWLKSVLTSEEGESKK